MQRSHNRSNGPVAIHLGTSQRLLVLPDLVTPVFPTPGIPGRGKRELVLLDDGDLQVQHPYPGLIRASVVPVLRACTNSALALRHWTMTGVASP